MYEYSATMVLEYSVYGTCTLLPGTSTAVLLECSQIYVLLHLYVLVPGNIQVLLVVWYNVVRVQELCVKMY